MPDPAAPSPPSPLTTSAARLRAGLALLPGSTDRLDALLAVAGGSRKAAGAGPHRLVDPLDPPEVTAAKQAARARRRRGAPRTYVRTRIARGELPAPRVPLDHEHDTLPRAVRRTAALPRSALDVLAAVLQLHGQAEAEDWHVETYLASLARMAMLGVRRTRDLLALLRAEGLVTTERLAGVSHRHRRLRVTPTAKARPAPPPRRRHPREVALAYRLLSTAARAGTPREAARARDELARFYRRGRYVEDRCHMQGRAHVETPTVTDSNEPPAVPLPKGLQEGADLHPEANPDRPERTGRHRKRSRDRGPSRGSRWTSPSRDPATPRRARLDPSSPSSSSGGVPV